MCLYSCSFVRMCQYTWLITVDVTSMYTHMTAIELVQSVAKALTKLKQNEVTIKIQQVEYLIELLKILVVNNEFQFDGHLYKQISGASMGAVPSPKVSDPASLIFLTIS